MPAERDYSSLTKVAWQAEIWLAIRFTVPPLGALDYRVRCAGDRAKVAVCDLL